MKGKEFWKQFPAVFVELHRNINIYISANPSSEPISYVVQHPQKILQTSPEYNPCNPIFAQIYYLQYKGYPNAPS